MTKTLEIPELKRFSEKLDLLGRDIHKLKPEQWLNDEIVNNYLMMIEKRGRTAGSKYPSVFSYSTHFFTRLVEKGHAGVIRWKRGVNLFKQDLLLIPVNVNKKHWILVVVDVQEKTVFFCDSMGSKGFVIFIMHVDKHLIEV